MINLQQQSRESEEVVLGYCLFNLLSGKHGESRIVFAELTPDNFLNPKLKHLYSVLTQYLDKPVTVAEVSNSSGFDVEFVRSIYDKHSNFIGVNNDIKHIKEMSRRADAIRKFETAKNELQSNGDVEQIITDLSEYISEVQLLLPDDEKTTREVIDSVVSSMEHTKANGYDKTKYIDVGIRSLDSILGGMEGGWLILLGARPGMGKTQLSLVIAENIAKSGKPVCFFSLEMSREELIRRLLLKGTKITSSEAKHGEFTMEQLKHVHDNAKNIYNIPMMINDRGGVTVAYIDNMIRRECVKHDVRFVVIDYMQLISGVKNESTYERATRVANELKNIAKKYNVVIMALSQLNRLNEQRKDRRPNMSELRDSGSLEQNADVIMLLYRDGYYTQNSSDTDLEVNIAKHRHGKAGTVKLYYNPKWGSITDLEKEYE